MILALFFCLPIIIKNLLLSSQSKKTVAVIYPWQKNPYYRSSVVHSPSRAWCYRKNRGGHLSVAKESVLSFIRGAKIRDIVHPRYIHQAELGATEKSVGVIYPWQKNPYYRSSMVQKSEILFIRGTFTKQSLALQKNPWGSFIRGKKTWHKNPYYRSSVVQKSEILFIRGTFTKQSLALQKNPWGSFIRGKRIMAKESVLSFIRGAKIRDIVHPRYIHQAELGATEKNVAVIHPWQKNPYYRSSVVQKSEILFIRGTFTKQSLALQKNPWGYHSSVGNLIQLI